MMKWIVFDAKSAYEWKICESVYKCRWVKKLWVCMCVSGKNDEANDAKCLYEWEICESVYVWVKKMMKRVKNL